MLNDEIITHDEMERQATRNVKKYVYMTYKFVTGERIMSDHITGICCWSKSPVSSNEAKSWWQKI